MRKTRNFLISIMSIVFFAAVGFLGLTISNENKAVNADVFISVEYKDTYVIGETVAIQSAEFDYQGKKYPANVLVRFPNGNSYRYDEFVLTEAGEYSIEYSAVAENGTLLKQTKSFTVLADTYSIDGDGEYTYGTNRYLEDDVQGLNVKLGRNSTFTINTPVNVSNLTKDDSILKFYATPDLQGTAEVGWLYVRLTDVHDSSRFVEWLYQPVATFQYVYGNANGQLTTALRQTSTPSVSSVEYDGYYYNVSLNNTKKVGHVTRASLTGTMDSTNATNIVTKYFPNNAEYTEKELFYYNALEVRMDYNQKRLYSQPDGVYAISRAIVADFDDERTLGGKAPWEGFTTGEVYISISAKDYTASSFNFFITDIYGQDIDKTTTKNEIPPQLSVDTMEYDVNNLPNAIVGKKYPLFDAVATDDVDGNVEVSVKVCNSIGASFSVVDNCFIPTQSGVYTVEYSAVDAFGNKAVKTLKVNAIARNQISYEFSFAETSFRAGETVSVKEITLLNPANLYELTMYAKNLDNNVEYPIGKDDLTFVPLYAGAYTITYIYTDYCTEEVIAYDITVTDSDLVVFDDAVTLPKYIIRGLSYPVVEMYGYTFVGGTERKLAKLYIQEAGGTEQLVSGDAYSVAGNVNSVDLIYEIDGVRQIYQRPVVDAVTSSVLGDKVDLSKYFYPIVGGFKSAGDNKKIKFEVTDSENGAAKLEVINPARLINDFNIGFYVENESLNFTGIKVVLQGAYDSTKTVEFRFEREVGAAAKAFISANGFYVEGNISSKFRTPITSNDNFNITYDSTIKTFDIGGLVLDANKLMEGFDDLFYISFELYGISGSSAINISRVVNQKITSDPYDSVRPTVLYGSFKGFYVVGDEVKVNKIALYDFVDPNPTCVVTLQNTAGYLTSVDGVKLDGQANDFSREYVVKVESIDRMNFKIVSQDFSYQKTDIRLPLLVKDVVAPTITLNVTNNLYKVGDTATIADFVVDDETTAQSALEVTCYVVRPNGSVQYLSDKSFAADQAGTYLVYYIVRDEAGNNGYANYSVIVE